MWCFMLDRIFDNWCNEAAYTLDIGTAMQLDKVAEEFVMAGPFWVVDMSNATRSSQTNTRQQEAEGDCYKPANIWNSVLRWLVATKRDQQVDVPDEVRQVARTRFQGILFSQSLDIVARQIGTPEDLNLGCTPALGFKKGPLELRRESWGAPAWRCCAISKRLAPDSRSQLSGSLRRADSIQPIHLGGQAGRRSGHHHSPPGADECHHRQGQRRDPGGTSTVPDR